MGYKFIMVCILTFISCYVSAQVEDDMDMSIEGLEDISVIPDSLFEVNAPIVHKYYLGNGLRFSSPDGNYMMNLTGYVQSTFLTQTYSGDDDLCNERPDSLQDRHRYGERKRIIGRYR
jgi:hypothetical protein